LFMVDSVEIRVFTYKGQGGNPCSVVLDADALTTDEMRAFAGARGHECGFCLSSTTPDFDYKFRFFVPNHEMEMCGHATIGLLWCLARDNILDKTNPVVATNSGLIQSEILFDDHGPVVKISQPCGRVENIAPEMTADVLTALDIDRGALADLPIQNATTSRTKTLIPLVSAQALQSVRPDPERIKRTCVSLRSTGLYPYISLDLEKKKFEARQFPKDSGYIEDPATGIAAAALAYGLLANGLITTHDVKLNRGLTVYQGRFMGNLSQIKIEWCQNETASCWITGQVKQQC